MATPFFLLLGLATLYVLRSGVVPYNIQGRGRGGLISKGVVRYNGLKEGFLNSPDKMLCPVMLLKLERQEAPGGRVRCQVLYGTTVDESHQWRTRSSKSRERVGDNRDKAR